MSMGGYAASLTGVSGGVAPLASSESSISRWAALDDLGRRSIVEYMDMESLGGTDRAMTRKVGCFQRHPTLFTALVPALVR